MSVKVMGQVWDADLERDLKFILMAYADHAQHDGTRVYPSVGLIAWKTGYSERQVQRITKKLVELDILVLDGTSYVGTNLYTINTKALPTRNEYERPSKTGRPERGDILSPGGDILSPGGDILSPGGDISRESGDIAMSPDSSLEPLLINTIPDESDESKGEVLSSAKALDLLNGSNGGSNIEVEGKEPGLALAAPTHELRVQMSEILKKAGVDDLAVESAILGLFKGNGKQGRVHRTPESVKAGIQSALNKGANRVMLLQESVEKAFRRNYLWNNRWARDTFMPWLQEQVRDGTEIDRFARWWKESDWRGKQGQAPTLAQIYEVWPQAFPASSVPLDQRENLRVTVNTSGELMVNNRYYVPTGQTISESGACIGQTRDGEDVYYLSDECLGMNGQVYKLNPNIF